MFLVKTFRTILRLPLKRRMCFWHKIGNACRNMKTPVSVRRKLVVQFHNIFYNFSDTIKVFVGFSRKSHHKIELYAVPTKFNRFCNRPVNIIFRNIFIDYIAQPLCSCLRCKSKPRFPALLKFFHHCKRKIIKPQRRQGNRKIFFFADIHQLNHQRLKFRIITSRKRQQ